MLERFVHQPSGQNIFKICTGQFIFSVIIEKYSRKVNVDQVYYAVQIASLDL